MKNTFTLILFLNCSFLFSQSADFNRIEQEINQKIQQGQWDDVLVQATDLLIEAPDRGEGYYYTAIAFFKQEHYEQAKEYLQQSTPLADADLNEKIALLDQEILKATKQQQLLNSAEEQIQAGNDIAAAQAYQNVWKSNKQDVNAALNAVEIFLEHEEYEQALAILNDGSLSKDPGALNLIRRINDTPQMMQINGYNAAMNEAQTLFRQENYGSAILLYDKALVFQPEDSKALQAKKTAEDELAWKNTRTEHSIEGYQTYLAGKTIKKYKDQAIELIRDGLLFHGEKAAMENNIATMEYYLFQFLNSYGGSQKDTKVKEILCTTYRSNAANLEGVKSAYSQQRVIEFYNSVQKYCPGEDLSEKIKLAEKKQIRYGRPDRAYLSYVYDSIAPIGLSMGSINNQSVGMYLAGSLNKDIFTEGALYTVDNEGNFDGSPGSSIATGEKKVGYGDAVLGLTKKITYPLWIYAGGGAAFTDVYEGREESTVTEWVKNTDESNISMIGDLGIIVDFSGLFLRAGVKSDFKEYRLAGGIGFSW